MALICQITTRGGRPECAHPAEDGHQVMLAHGEHVDVFDDHHLVVVFVKDGVVQHVCGEKKTEEG